MSLSKESQDRLEDLLADLSHEAAGVMVSDGDPTQAFCLISVADVSFICGVIGTLAFDAAK